MYDAHLALHRARRASHIAGRTAQGRDAPTQQHPPSLYTVLLCTHTVWSGGDLKLLRAELSGGGEEQRRKTRFRRKADQERVTNGIQSSLQQKWIPETPVGSEKKHDSISLQKTAQSVK